MTPTLLTQAHNTARRRQEPTDWYTVGLGVLIVAGYPIQALIGVATRSSTPGHFPGAPVVFTIGMVVIVVAGALAAAQAIGPLRVSRAEYSCVLSAPVDRPSELRRRWLVNIATGGSLGAIVGLSAVLLTGADIGVAVSGAVLGGAAGAAVMNSATALQATAGPVRARVQAGAGLVAFAALVTTATVPSAPVNPQANEAVWMAAATVGLVASGLAARWAWSTVATLDRVALTAGNALATATSAAVLFLDPGLLGGVLTDRRLARSRVSHSRSLPAGRLKALVLADVVRSVRNRRALAVFAAAAVVPYAAATVLPVLWVPVVALVSGVAAVSPFAVGFRQISTSPVLRRMLGGSNTLLLAGHLVVPAVLAAVYAVATAPAAPEHLVAAAVCVPLGIILNLWARSSGRPASFGATVADFGFGPVPVDLARFVVRGLGPLAVVVLIQVNL